MVERRLRVDGESRLRAICCGLPEVTVHTDGSPALEHHARAAVVYRVRSRSFAWYLDNHHGDGRVALWCKASPGAREILLDSAPGRFFVPPYLGRRGWVGVSLDRDVDWDEVADLVEQSYRLSAPKRLIAALDKG